MGDEGVLWRAEGALMRDEEFLRGAEGASAFFFLLTVAKHKHFQVKRK